MAKRRSQKFAGGDATQGDSASKPGVSREQMPAAELLSFLKGVRRTQTWTEKDLAKTLKIDLPQAKEAMSVLQLQGYIEPAGNTGKWRVSEQGDLVSGAKPPRFTRQSVEEALASLRDRIKAINDDPDAPYKITDAVAFGDFLSDAARVQAAEVGIRLLPRSDHESGASAREHRAEIGFLKQVRGKTPVLHIVAYEDWMSSRSHERLL
jgi:hypothetical protein